ncbi:MAG TPA: LEPR-XLL domain-containing protein, partial [Burkholderiales bacterium]|nr:LEPR-XLL domain-containing protein [Burkholderiales bacterium]
MNSPADRPFRLKPRSAQTPPFRRRILFEALEPRVLLSADASPESAIAAFLVQKDRDQDAQPPLAQIDASPSAALIEFEGASADLEDDSWIVDVPAKSPDAQPPIQSQVVFLDLDGA